MKLKLLTIKNIKKIFNPVRKFCSPVEFIIHIEHLAA